MLQDKWTTDFYTSVIGFLCIAKVLDQDSVSADTQKQMTQTQGHRTQYIEHNIRNTIEHKDIKHKIHQKSFSDVIYRLTAVTK